ncbi:hypothetical protein K431DRAFT_171260 [Polychaeton citri CBS 116435]|uniref:Uncharacterized protein n=1 Tax=Polychaeton citri CBS 116435 TaxID=1314669 RepID=A0A9P4UKY6_9PEZI|nr:hypothetical protein K431DRAFT_171260 [Polychaeton citri CBS 116435]
MAIGIGLKVLGVGGGAYLIARKLHGNHHHHPSCDGFRRSPPCYGPCESHDSLGLPSARGHRPLSTSDTEIRMPSKPSIIAPQGQSWSLDAGRYQA